MKPIFTRHGVVDLRCARETVEMNEQSIHIIPCAVCLEFFQPERIDSRQPAASDHERWIMLFGFYIFDFHFFRKIHGQADGVDFVCRFRQTECSGGIFPAFGAEGDRVDLPFVLLSENLRRIGFAVDSVGGKFRADFTVLHDPVSSPGPERADSDPFHQVQLFRAFPVPGIKHSAEDRIFLEFPFRRRKHAIRTCQNIAVFTGQAQFKITGLSGGQGNGLTGDGSGFRLKREQTCFESFFPMVEDFQTRRSAPVFPGPVEQIQFRFRCVAGQQNIAVSLELNRNFHGFIG